jgi:lipid II:glycine glycyltransferase (peptidoglycan interpeptide bridge formation enzyme)
MTLSVRSLSESEASVWDGFVSCHPNGHFMQSWAWGQFRAAQGWEPFRFLVTEMDKPKAAMQVLYKRFPGGSGVMYAPRGPVVECGDDQSINVLLEAVKSLNLNAISLRLDPYFRENVFSSFNDSGVRALPESWSHWNAPKYVFWLDLQLGIDLILKKMSSSQRSEIRYPYKKDVKFFRDSVENIDDFYNMMVKTANLKKIACRSKNYFKELINILEKFGMSNLFFANYNGLNIATGLSIIYGDKSWLMYAASDKEYYHLRSNRALQWEMIRVAAESGCVRYDFRGTATSNPPNPEDPGYGVYEYKKSFGPEFINLAGYYDVVYKPLMYRGLRLMELRSLPMFYSTYKKVHSLISILSATK